MGAKLLPVTDTEVPIRPVLGESASLSGVRSKASEVNGVELNKTLMKYPPGGTSGTGTLAERPPLPSEVAETVVPEQPDEKVLKQIV